jgi:hypothetical protein
VNGERVKANLVLALLALAGLTVAGCGSSKGAVTGPITVSGTTTISNVKVGTLIRCKGGPAVPAPRWFGGSALTVPGVPGQIDLIHRHNGSVTVTCQP